MRRPVHTFIAVLAGTTLATGCTSTAAGHAEANRAHASRPVAGAALDNVLLSPQQLGGIVGAQLQVRVDQKQPVGGGPSGPCAALANAGSEAIVGKGFSAYHVLALADSSDKQPDHIVVQAVGIYTDARTATQQFTSATRDLGVCNGRRVNDEAYWRYAVNDVTPDTVRWNKTETDVPWPWVCHGQQRVRNNAIVVAMSCQADEAGAAHTDTIVNQMSATLWNLSSPNGSP